VKEQVMPATPFTRLLVATGGSPWSERALTVALQMAQAYRLEVVVVAVLTPAYVPQKKATWGVATTADVEESARQRAQRVLDGASRLAQAHGIKHVCELREGRAVEQILAAAGAHQCDLIIIGSRGLSGVSRVTLGETGNEVLLKAPIPVMVVK
jgi:nucleotide-binding universal stress UspA family protein